MADQATEVQENTTNVNQAESESSLEPTPVFQVPDTVKEYVGEGKKYATPEAALSSIAPAQEHISKLEEENKSYKEQLEALQAELLERKTAEELFQKMTTAKPNNEQEEPNHKFDDIQKAINEALASREAMKVKEQNVEFVNQTLHKTYGDKANDVIEAKAKELGVSKNYLQNIAVDAPKAFLKVLGLDGNTKVIVPTTYGSDVNTTALENNQQPTKSAKIGLGANTKQMVSAVQAAREKVLNSMKG